MRKLKFRVWDKHEEEMIYSPIGFSGSEQGKGNWIVIFNRIPQGSLSVADALRPLEDYEIMQFSGLKDKNGKEIYESDIVKMSSWEEREQFGDKREECEGIFLVKVVLGSYGYAFDFEPISGYSVPTHLFMNDANPFEVIGNIFENPELLKKKRLWKNKPLKVENEDEEKEEFEEYRWAVEEGKSYDGLVRTGGE